MRTFMSPIGAGWAVTLPYERTPGQDIAAQAEARWITAQTEPPGTEHVNVRLLDPFGRMAEALRAFEEMTIEDLAALQVGVTVCPNCGQWQRPENGGDCLNECRRRGFAPTLCCAKCVRPMAGSTAYDGACDCGGLIKSGGDQ